MNEPLFFLRMFICLIRVIKVVGIGLHKFINLGLQHIIKKLCWCSGKDVCQVYLQPMFEPTSMHEFFEIFKIRNLKNLEISLYI